MDLMYKIEHIVLKMDQTDAKLQAVSMENQQLRVDALDAKKQSDNHIILLQDQVDELSTHEMTPKETRRSSTYGGKVYTEPPPKVLTSGNEFDDMPKFANKRSRDILKHLADFRDKSETYEKGYWIHLFKLTVDPMVALAIKNEGIGRLANRDGHGCKAGWEDFDEFETWICAKYLRPEHNMELLHDLF